MATSNRETAKLHHVENWIFDLDNTLYAANAGLLGAVEARICLFVETELGLDKTQAWAVQKAYFREFGTTLAGLMQRHGTDAESYLAFVNDVALAGLMPDPALAAGLARLPGRRFVFTNNCGRYAERVLAQLGVSHLFDDVWDVRTMGFVPKPSPAAYDIVLRHGAVRPQSAAMFDDIPANLKIPHMLGMTTIWLRTSPALGDKAPHIHHEIDNLPAFLHAIEVAAPP